MKIFYTCVKYYTYILYRVSPRRANGSIESTRKTRTCFGVSWENNPENRRWNRTGDDHRPWNSGSRSSRNAATVSAWSSVCEQTRCARVACSKACSRTTSGVSFRRALLLPSATGDFPARAFRRTRRLSQPRRRRQHSLGHYVMTPFLPRRASLYYSVLVPGIIANDNE